MFSAIISAFNISVESELQPCFVTLAEGWTQPVRFVNEHTIFYDVRMKDGCSCICNMSMDIQIVTVAEQL